MKIIATKLATHRHCVVIITQYTHRNNYAPTTHYYYKRLYYKLTQYDL